MINLRGLNFFLYLLFYLSWFVLLGHGNNTSMSVLNQEHKGKMAGYWPSSLFAFYGLR